MKSALLLIAGCTRVLGVHDFAEPDAGLDAAPSMQLDAPPDADTDLLLAHLSFDQAPIGHDVTGHGHDGTCVGTCTGEHGIIGSSIGFDGGSTMPIATPFPAGVFTVAMWVLVQALPMDEQCAFSRPYGNTGLASIALCVRARNGEVELHFDYAPTASAQSGLTATSASNLSFWQHVAMTWDGGELRLFHNGAFFGASQSGIVLDDSPMVLATGEKAKDFAGELDEVYVYGRVLSDDEIKGLYTH